MNKNFETRLKNAELSLEHYKRDAKLDLHQKKRHKLVKNLVANNGKGNALDIGCGYGDITNNISSYFDSIIGIDFVHERMLWASNEYPEISFLVSDACNLPFKSSSFDTVLSVVVINWLDFPEKHFAEVKDILTHEGIFILVVKAPNTLREFIRKIMGKKKIEKDIYKLSNIRNLLNSHNFDIKNITPFYDPIVELFKSPKSFLAMLLLIPMRIINSKYFSDYYAITAVVSK